MAAGYIPNLATEETPKLILQCLKDKENIIIFPEGTRSIPGKPLKLQRGAANLAIRAPAEIRLIRLNVTKSGLTKQDRWLSIPQKRVQYSVAVGERIHPLRFLEEANEIPSLAARRLTAYLTQVLQV